MRNRLRNKNYAFSERVGLSTVPTLGPGHPGIPDDPWKFTEMYTKTAFSHWNYILLLICWVCFAPQQINHATYLLDDVTVCG